MKVYESEVLRRIFGSMRKEETEDWIKLRAWGGGIEDYGKAVYSYHLT
jgi:hypothetical protein